MALGEMTDLELLDSAAEKLRDGHELTQIQRLMLADILEGERQIRSTMEPFVDLLNYSVEQAGGGEAWLRLARHEDSGEIRLWADNTTNSVHLARDILNAKEAK